MRIIVVGATGTIGSAVTRELEKRHDVVKVGLNHGDIHVDITDSASIQRMYEDVLSFDAVVSATGRAYFGPFDELDEDKFSIGIESKLLGQINLVLLGHEYIDDGGSFTLTSGILSEDPVPGGAMLSMVNAAVDGFVTGASIELPRGIRLNSVSPEVVLESMDKFAPFFRGHTPVPAEKVALAYSKSVEGKLTGRTFKVGG